ncbi:Peroxisomal multifunctional enzyme type 2 [Phytophthora cinnamomi]|uniref:Peroxisomal multifunctional enzyme type 2 n=1 Tax=Phytophthora cinnamomi TaxID=4785 RepID=UPI00355A987B|nr:Peroxisomal multifunctional enzyme type 2 [Phytophthora cinnamomi]
MAPRAAELFSMMSGAVDEVGPSLVSKVKGVIKFDIEGAGAWLVDLKSGKGSVKPAAAADKADLTISLSEDNFLKMMDNKLNPQQAFMKGLVKIKGNMGLAMKLNVVLAATRNYMKKQGTGAKPVAAAAPAAASAAAPAAGGLSSKEIFRLLGEVVAKDGAAMAKKVKGIIQFDVTGAGKWNLDLKSATPALTEGSKKADVTITVADADFVAIAMGKLNAQQAFMKGKLKLKGNMTLAMKLPVVFNALKPQSKL